MAARPRLTVRLQRVYDFIVAWKRDHDGNSPSIHDIVAGLGYHTTSAVNYHLERLEALDLVRLGPRQPNGYRRARCIEVVGGTWTAPEPRA